MLSAMVRPEDTIRVPRSYHGGGEEDVGSKNRPDSGISPRSSYNPEKQPREDKEEGEKEEGEGNFDLKPKTDVDSLGCVGKVIF